MILAELADIATIFAAVFALLSPVFGFLFWRNYKVLEAPDSDDFKELKESLKESSKTLTNIYEKSLGKALGWADRFFEDGDRTPRPVPSDPASLPNPWSVRTYRRCMVLALAYPLSSALFAWVSFGEAGALGAQLGLVSGIEGWLRFVAFLCLVISICAYVAHFRLEGWKSVVAIAVAVAFAGAFTVAVAFAFAFVGAGAGAVAVAFAFAGAGAVAVAFAFAGAGAFAVAFAVAFAGAGAVAVAVAGAFALYWIEDNISKQTSRHSAVYHFVFWIGLTVFGLCAAWLTVQLTAGPSTLKKSYILLVGLLLLPFLNAPFDWFSIGLTRSLLRKNSVKSSLLSRLGWSLADFFVALTVMVALAATLVCFLEFINATGAAKGLPWPVADIGGTLQGIQKNPWAVGNMWVYFTLFSTLIPTIIHLGIFLFSGVCSYKTSVNAWAYRKICEVHKGPMTRHKLATFLTVRLGIALVLTAIVSFAFIWGFMSLSPLGSHFLEFLQGVQIWSQATFTELMKS